MSVPQLLHGVPSVHQQLMPRSVLPRHRHASSYAALIIAGSYEEAGDGGRRSLQAGDVVVHDAFSAHRNFVGMDGANLLNLPMPGGVELFGSVRDLDAVVQLAASDLRAASEALRLQLQPKQATLQDWPDLLAHDMKVQPGLSLTAWAQDKSLSAETLSRGFRRVFGVTPRRWRFELRARRALSMLLSGRESLACVALDAGFADQAHLTHAVVALTGQPPAHWRRTSTRDKTSEFDHRIIGT